MSKKVSLKIDGKNVKVPEGTNLIEAAKSADIHIPNLCYLKGMRGIGACRLCLVEVEGAKAPAVACISRVKEGMNVTTTNENLQEMRKFVIDLILSMHPLDCMTCTKAGVCNLQQYAYDFELQESNFTRKKFGYPTDEANPFIKRDPDYCILCGRCVRVCKEQGTNVLDFMGRGVGAKVVTSQDKPLQESECTFCGSCVDACPVNSLLEADRWRKGREWEYSKTDTVCLSCGNGCDIIASSKDGSVVKINAGADDGSVEKYICARGRFGFDALTSDQRVTSPMKRVGKELVETSWQDALKIAAEQIKRSGKNTGIVSTAGILNQDAFILSKFGSEVVKTSNIDTTVSLYADMDSMKQSDRIEIDGADLIIMAGVNTSQYHRVSPALDAAVRKRVSRGAKLVVINSGDSDLASIAAVSIKGDEASSLAQIARSMTNKGLKPGKTLEAALSKVSTTEETDKAAELIANAGMPVIFTAPSLFSACKNLSLLKDIKVSAVPLEANARGVTAMGLYSNGKSYSEMITGGTNTLYVVGEVPVRKRPKVKFLIVQSPYLTDLAKQADIVLPAASFLESKGTVINYLGKVKELSKVVDPPDDAKQHKDIIIELSKVIGKSLKVSSSTIKSAFESGVKAKFSTFEKKKGLDINISEFIDSVNAPVTNSSRLLWLKETELAVSK